MATLRELSTILNRRFQRTLQQDLQAATLLGELTEKQKLIQETYDTLSQTRNGKLQEKENELSTLDTLVRRLQQEVSVWTEKVEKEMNEIQQQLQEMVDQATARHNEKRVNLNDTITALVRDMNVMAEEYRKV